MNSSCCSHVSSKLGMLLERTCPTLSMEHAFGRGFLHCASNVYQHVIQNF